eukprot:scaffold114_cov361-Pinguiococcus_pyrenoidosus.AAC.35
MKLVSWEGRRPYRQGSGQVLPRSTSAARQRRLLPPRKGRGRRGERGKGANSLSRRTSTSAVPALLRWDRRLVVLGDRAVVGRVGLRQIPSAVQVPWGAPRTDSARFSFTQCCGGAPPCAWPGGRAEAIPRFREGHKVDEPP